MDGDPSKDGLRRDLRGNTGRCRSVKDETLMPAFISNTDILDVRVTAALLDDAPVTDAAVSVTVKDAAGTESEWRCVAARKKRKASS
jgi:hypothetical protein